jgi:hypothetical protein
MRKIVLFIAFLFGTMQATHAQSLNQVNKQLDSLNAIRKNIQLKIKDYQGQLQIIKQQVDDLEAKKASMTASSSQSGDFIVAKVMSGGAVLRDSPNSTGKTLLTIPGNETINVYRSQQNLYFKVSYKGQTGYVSYSTISQNQEIDDFLAGKEPVKQTTTTTTTVRTVNESDPRYQKLVKLYGKDRALKIMNNELWQGMSYGMVLESIGKPNSKNSDNTPDGMKEQWLYNDYTLEFLNGELKNWTKK